MPTIAATYSATELFKIAKMAYERTNDGSSERVGDKYDAVVAIVFAAFSLEAFINELVDLADNPVLSDSPAMRSFVALVKEVEELQGSVKLKYMLAKVAFTGTPFNKGESPFQDFVQLFKLRDMLVHYKPEDKYHIDSEGKSETHSYPKIILALRSKNILAQARNHTIEKWLTLISTRACAYWACNATCEMIQLILNALPEGKLTRFLKPFYQEVFQLSVQ